MFRMHNISHVRRRIYYSDIFINLMTRLPAAEYVCLNAYTYVYMFFASNFELLG